MNFCNQTLKNFFLSVKEVPLQTGGVWPEKTMTVEIYIYIKGENSLYSS